MTTLHVVGTCARGVVLCACVVMCACSRPADHARRLVDRGTALVDAEQYEQALKLYRMAVDADPTFEDAHLQLALLFDTYLHDTSNAVASYERYLATAKNETMRENARRWLENARQSGAAHAAVAAVQNIVTANLSVEEELAKRDLQFEAVRRQTAERYEQELENARKEMRAAQDRVAALERENSTLRGAGNAASRAELLDAIASNRQVVTELQARLVQKEQDVQERVQSHELLQSMVTNLQAQLALRDEPGTTPAALTAATNQLAELRRIASERTRQYETSAQELEQERTARTGLEQQLRALQQRYDNVQQQYAQADQSSRTTSTSRDSTPALATLAPATAAGPGVRTVQQTVSRTVAASLPGGAPALRSSVSAPAPGASMVVPAAPAPASAGRVYTVQTGDSLMRIARDVYGDGNRWTAIFNANRDVLDRPNQLRVGQVLRIP